MPGWLDWSVSAVNINTGRAARSQICPVGLPYFANSKNLFKCPSDNFLSSFQRAQRYWPSRARSMSGNAYLGSDTAPTRLRPGDPNYVLTTKFSQLINPARRQAGCIWMKTPTASMTRVFPAPQFANGSISRPTITTAPAASPFADGHSEIHKWQSSLISTKVIYTVPSALSVAATDKDCWWLRERTQRKPGFP